LIRGRVGTRGRMGDDNGPHAARAPPWLAFIFLWRFAVVLGAALSVVRRADHLAVGLGAPYGIDSIIPVS
jgi:hypothetical protein